RALACLNHVLALDATNERALGLLKSIQRQQRRRTWRRRGIRAGIGAGVALALGLGGWQVYRMNAGAPETPKVETAGPRTDGTKATVGTQLPTGTAAATGMQGSQVAGAPSGTQGTGGTPNGTQGTGGTNGSQGAGASNGSQIAGAPNGSQGTGDATGTPGGSRSTGAQGTGGTGTPVRDPDTNPRLPSPTERTARPTMVASLDPQDDPKSSRAGRIPVSILVRPYGSIRVDDGPAGTQQLAQHDVHLTPGPHTITVSCGYCEDATETIDVKPNGENVFRLRALLKSSRLALDYQPPDATVRVGDAERTAHDSLQNPFDIRSPRGPASFQHRVEVEISSPGYKTEKRVVLLEPGKPTTLRGSLAPE
ncbi:serine/threonine protein kinase, partial [Corallococcus macrosporus]|nr:serine/threonine protein kinase [Corallococcus macrosporus]